MINGKSSKSENINPFISETSEGKVLKVARKTWKIRKNSRKRDLRKFACSNLLNVKCKVLLSFKGL
jgi:hypothetical protein